MHTFLVSVVDFESAGKKTCMGESSIKILRGFPQVFKDIFQIVEDFFNDWKGISFVLIVI